jgi:diguanylate cyclase (GGDEF)-like protein
MMFRKIYEQSWGFVHLKPGSPEAHGRLQKMYTRLVEELSELGEAVRFSHLYPTNFDNELADYVAWLFGLVSSIHYASAEPSEVALIADLFWPSYPGICTVCMLDLCDCRPSPVRELQSKPSLSELEYTDGLTQASNKARFERNMTDISNGSLPFPAPISCIHIDVDDFKQFNSSPFDHSTGDAALKHLANVIRQKVRTRDRIFRVGGDEFAILCPDLSASEAAGMMSRVARALKERPIPKSSSTGSKPPAITLSVGIAECLDPLHIREDFARADTAAIDSKNTGKDRVTIGNTPPSEQTSPVKVFP